MVDCLVPGGFPVRSCVARLLRVEYMRKLLSVVGVLRISWLVIGRIGGNCGVGLDVGRRSSGDGEALQMPHDLKWKA